MAANGKLSTVDFLLWQFLYFFMPTGLLQPWSHYLGVGKGQLISKFLLGVIISTKKTTKFFLRISALASNKRLNQKFYYTKYVQ